MFDRHDLYERCVQSTDHLEPLLSAIHGNDPRVLAEDFAAGGALSRAWVDAHPDRSAIAVDHDPGPLERCAGHDRIKTITADVRQATDSADLLFAGNFSIGELHDRAEVLAYMRHARERLNPGGVFVCDTYGGETAYFTGAVERDHTGPDGELVRYTWEQIEADPLTARVRNALHFDVYQNGAILQKLTDAFVYDWRLWSVPELRDLLLEAGFGTTEVYSQTLDAMDEDGRGYALPITDPEELDGATFIVCVAARL